jgi:septation ring formation regulator EzrA
MMEELQKYSDKIATEFRKIPQNYKLIEEYGHIDQEVHDISEEYEILKLKINQLEERMLSARFGLKIIEATIEDIKEQESSHAPPGDPYLP